MRRGWPVASLVQLGREPSRSARRGRSHWPAPAASPCRAQARGWILLLTLDPGRASRDPRRRPSANCWPRPQRAGCRERHPLPCTNNHRRDGYETQPNPPLTRAPSPPRTTPCRDRTHAHPAGVVSQVVHAVRNRLAEGLVQKVVDPNRLGLTARTPLPLRVLERADQLLFLRVHRHHWLAPPLKSPHPAVDVVELRRPDPDAVSPPASYGSPADCNPTRAATGPPNAR